MKAVVFYEHGGLEQVQVAEVGVPEIGAEDVLVQVKAAALNRLDLWVLAGWPSLKLHLPHILGSDGAGVIAQVGANVTGWAVGDRVAINPTLSCGRCRFCVAGRDNLCDSMAIMGEHAPVCWPTTSACPPATCSNCPPKCLLPRPPRPPWFMSQHGIR